MLSFTDLISLASAAVISIVTNLVVSYYFLVPGSLKHLPVIPIFGHLKLILTGRQVHERFEYFAKFVNEDGLARIWANGTWAVLVAKPEYIKNVLSDVTTYPKSELLKKNPHGTFSIVMGDSILTTNGADWKRHKRVVAPAFHNFAPYVSVFQKAALEFASAVDKRQAEDVQEEVNVCDLFSLMAVDVISRAGFNLDVNALNEGTSKWFDLYRYIIKNLFVRITTCRLRRRKIIVFYPNLYY